MKCVICGKNIIRADLCNEHNAEYGSCASDRPVWLQEFIQSCKRENEYDESDYDFSLDYCEDIIASHPNRKFTGVTKAIYSEIGRLTENETIDDRTLVERLDPEEFEFPEELWSKYNVTRKRKANN